jgi:hypothetical protein
MAPEALRFTWAPPTTQAPPQSTAVPQDTPTASTTTAGACNTSGVPACLDWHSDKGCRRLGGAPVEV